MSARCTVCDAAAVELLELGPNLNAPLCEHHGTRWILSVFRRAAIRYRHEEGRLMAAHAFEQWVTSEKSDLPVDDVLTGLPDAPAPVDH